MFLQISDDTFITIAHIESIQLSRRYESLNHVVHQINMINHDARDGSPNFYEVPVNSGYGDLVQAFVRESSYK